MGFLGKAECKLRWEGVKRGWSMRVKGMYLLHKCLKSTKRLK